MEGLFQRCRAAVAPFFVIGQAGARRNQAPDNDVFLEPAQAVAAAAHRCFRKHAGRFLAHCLELFVLLDHARALHDFALEIAGICTLDDFDLAQHLADHDFDVLVVDLHTLQAINILDFLDQVFGQGLRAEQAQDVMRVQLAVGDHLTLLHVLTLEHVDVAPFRYQRFDRLVVVPRNDQALLALGFLAEAHGTGGLGHDGGFLRFTRLEQVGNARQTTGDVTGLA